MIPNLLFESLSYEDEIFSTNRSALIFNKNMKILVKNFYDILLNCENYSKKNTDTKNMFFNKYLDHNKAKKEANYL